jgi:predicted peptidase
MQPQHMERTITRTVRLNYLRYLPPDYTAQPAWPLILFLHGRGERGDDLDLVKLHGLPQRLANGDNFPFIITAPQCPSASYWTNELDELNALLDHLIETYPVDTTRIYLTGMSMGGRGTWFLAGRYPERFAAIAPICGAGLNWIAAERLAGMPTWIFHGADDDVAPVAASEEMAGWLHAAGNNQVRLTIYPGVKHDSWVHAYHNPELYDWFLRHRKR